MKTLRVVVVSTIVGLALVFPWVDLGDDFPILAPVLLGVSISWLFADFNIRARALLLCSLVMGIALAPICLWAVLLDDWSFDGKRNLAILSVAVQLFSAAAAFGGTWLVLQLRVRPLPPAKRFGLICGIIFGTIGMIASVIHATISRLAVSPFNYDFEVYWCAPFLAAGRVFGLNESTSDWVWGLLEVGLNTPLCVAVGALVGLLIHRFSFGGDASRIRRASMIVSVPAVLLNAFWCMIFFYPPITMSESAELCWQALSYLNWVGLGLAVILFVRTCYSKGAVVCLVINLIGAALNIFGPSLVYWMSPARWYLTAS